MSSRPDHEDDDARDAMAREALEQRIRTLAYYMWEAEGRQAGRADEYYHRAREQLNADNPDAVRERSVNSKNKNKPPS
ncbi:conserved hypothetical protein [Burkholderia sp. 8Y]|uniref:DUF2934 domain-containing protein n=1 Tax=Burkholderia sp. 8Y TaxID=2653133 RepID=UPI0012EF6B34|nr:DUF2934 domain-containing protein [Burkholderia sp. 8Y]VXB42163.1 conserved hypothetical protein [Burkholderia sp. 8Y]